MRALEPSRRMAAVQTPIIPVIADLIRAHPGTISLGQGVVGYPPPPEAFSRMQDFLAEPGNHKYQPVAGIPALLDAIAVKLARENQIATGPASGSRVMVTAGGNQAFLNAVLAMADPGDEIILPTPYYFNQEMAITMANCRPVLVPGTPEHQPDLAALEAAITPRTRAIVTVSPNNPSGAVYPAATLRAVNELCARHGLFHLSDEAYEYFTYEGAAHFSPGSLPGSAAHTISLYSLSKAYGFASWRIGWMAYPASLEAALRKIQDTVLICPPVISQYAALGALATGTSYVGEKLKGISAVRALVQEALRPLSAEGICDAPAANGAFYFLLRVRRPAGAASLGIAEQLIRQHGVAVIPGSAFGLDQGCYLRVAYGALTPDAAREGVGRLVRGLRALAAG
jgi:aspartate/methionine/tyrosine aminotransferase